MSTPVSTCECMSVNMCRSRVCCQFFFAVRHYHLRDKKFDTFQADIQQIKIIKCNARDGPLDVMIGAATMAEDKECHYVVER
jgi:hypothetical protein